MSTPESPAALPPFLTTRQVAAALCCSPQTVRNWCKRGLLPPPLRVGKRKRLWNAGLVYEALVRLQQGA
jgi:DNA-binding transcriptional MerR regulator